MRGLTAFLLLVAAAPVRAQQPDPSAIYKTISTEHFRITYTPELAALAQPAANRAEEAWQLLALELVTPPKGKIDLVLTDVADYSNGYATPFPSNRIVIYAKPPVDDFGLQHYNDWLDLVITHELAHIFHLDRAGKVGRVLRRIFGRYPASWPFFPVLDMPRWNLEGLAVEFESRGTQSGRQHGSYHEMIVRTAVLEDRVDPIDRVSGETPIWPGGQRVYIYGALFNDYLARKHGAQAQAEIVRKTAGSILPPSLAANRIGKRATGTAFTDSYNEWLADLRRRYGALRDSLAAAGITQSEQVTSAGRIALYPRISNDGRRLAYAEETGRDVTMTHVIEIPSGRTVWRRRRIGTNPSDFAGDSTLITAQFEFADRYNVRSDLYRLGQGEDERLTRGARLIEVDVDRSGSRLVAVEVTPGSSRLVIADPNGNVLRALTPQQYGTDWSLPRWSPAGDRVAVARWQQGGRYDVVVLDTAGRVLHQLTDDVHIDAAPVWSPDGRYIVFSSDRTGITNLYAYDLQSSQLRQVTNVLGGAFHPEITPDGRSLYFSAYHADGYHIERIPFNPADWRAPGAGHPASAHRPRVTLDSAATRSAQVSASAPRDYSAWPTLRPFYWTAFGSESEHTGSFTGAATSGADLLARHSYAVAYAREFEKQRDEGYLAYAWSGLGNPTVGLSFARDWDYLGNVRLLPPRPRPDTSRTPLLEREDVGQFSLTFLRRRTRSSLSFTAGLEAARRRLVADTPNVRFNDPVDFTYGPVARVGFANYRTPAYAISREDGIALSFAGRIRRERDPVANLGAGYRELTTWNTAYKSIGTAGFAHHVLAARVSAIARGGPGLSLAEVGGAPGSLFNLGFGGIGEGGNFLPVRGFADAARLGSRAWSASLEYRLPVALVGRGYKLWPVFLDRVYASGFADAGNASCDAETRARLPRRCAPAGADPLVAAGAELAADLALLSFFTTRLRVGYGQPFNPGHSGKVYVSFGSAF